jgi:hypothetical protein
MSKYIKIILFVVMATGCVNSDDNTSKRADGPPAQPPAIPRKFCYVLCDFSASQDQQSRDLIIRNAKTIFSKAEEFSIRYYDISSAAFPSFFECGPRGGERIERPSEKIKRKEKTWMQADSLSKEMMRLSQLPSSSNTCIIKTIDKVCRSMKAQVSAKDTIKIVILSDMLEDCVYDFGEIDIDHLPYSKALQTLGKMPKPNCTFAGYKNIEVNIVAVSQKSLNTNMLEQFWDQVFLKYDLSSKPMITVELPGWIFY